MRTTIVLTLAIAVISAGLSAQTGNPREVRSSDPAMARTLESLSHPAQATVEVQEIKIPAGQYTHCVTRTNGNRTDSDCAPQVRFEEIHKLALTFSLSGAAVEVIGGCSSFENDHQCDRIALGGMGAPECHDGINKAGDVTHSWCSEKGSGSFVVERKKNKFFIYPVEGKPNRRYYIPLASIAGATIVPD
jgi:hypothetical protein